METTQAKSPNPPHQKLSGITWEFINLHKLLELLVDFLSTKEGIQDTDIS